MFLALRSEQSFWRPRKQQLYFVHVPKCGGSYVEATFGRALKNSLTNTHPKARGHLTYLEYKEVFRSVGVNLEELPTFAVVRNPWDWHVSWFHYIKGDTGGRKSGHRIEHDQFKNFSFADYVEWLDDPNALRSPMGYLQKEISDWIIDENEEIWVSRVLREECLCEDLEKFVDEMDLRVNVVNKICNSSKHDNFRRYYTDGLVEKVAKRHERDIAMFSYQF